MQNTSTQESLRRRKIISISSGNAIQITGNVLGFLLLWISIQPGNTVVRMLTMIACYLLIYFNSHSLFHYLIGKLTGIDFKHYSIGGSSHASSAPTIVSRIYGRLPFFAAHTDHASMKKAPRSARAWMFAAGIAGTVIFCTLASFSAYRADVPGGRTLFVFNIIWQLSSVIAEARPSGDIGKAIDVLRNKQER